MVALSAAASSVPHFSGFHVKYKDWVEQRAIGKSPNVTGRAPNGCEWRRVQQPSALGVCSTAALQIIHTHGPSGMLPYYK